MTKTEVSINILRKLVLDCFLLIGLGLCICATNVLWQPFQRGFFCGDQSLMYPYKGDTVTVLMLRLVGLLLPISAFLICEWTLLRNVRDSERCLGVRIPAWVRGFYSTLVCFAIGTCFVEIAVNISKNVIGRPRPHFFDICQPSINCSSLEWQDRYIQSSDYTCTGPQTDKYEDMRKSFLSGHSAWAAYTMVYLAMYLEGRMTWQGTRTLRHALQFGVVMLSWFTALSRVTDFKHHWSDVLAGYSLGVVFAVVMWAWGTDVVQKKKNCNSLPQFEIAITSQSMQPQR
ncbi:putative phosphatidate phosphatase [Spodoptera frugiperda]|uniref:Phosphatidate phosphatase n=1 Tax=Spodoptera frugiperda TaxID=7108 RepID=A0A9R0EIB1_SPOFR|nr:putative phosphatidate phosphatase [Spodoptera frugiperda]